MTQINQRHVLKKIKKFARYCGVALFVPFFLWIFLGLIPGVPSIVDVFGMDGLRIPTGIVIFGLMMAAFGFEDF